MLVVIVTTAPGVADGKRTKEEGVGKAEDRAICSDSESERQCRDGRKARISREHPAGVADLLEDHTYWYEYPEGLFSSAEICMAQI